MSNGIVIISSGFAARQLVKNVRKQDATIPLALIAADSSRMSTTNLTSAMLSVSRQRADGYRQTAVLKQFNLHLFPQTQVTDIDARSPCAEKPE